MPDKYLATLIFSIYLAALDAARWPDVLRAMAARLGEVGLSVVCLDPLLPQPLLVDAIEVPASILAEVREQCLAVVAGARRRRAGIGAYRIEGAQRLSNGSRYYRAGVLATDASGLTVAICLVHPDARGPVTDETLALAKQLAPHLLGSMALARRTFANGEPAQLRPADPRAATVRLLDRAALAARYDLTERELAVCEQFVDLAAVEDTARALGVEVSTIRFHLKSIYSKTEVRSLPALMRLLLGFSRAPGG